MAIDMEEIFLHGGQLVKELPQKELSQKEEANDKNTKKLLHLVLRKRTS